MICTVEIQPLMDLRINQHDHRLKTTYTDGEKNHKVT